MKIGFTGSQNGCTDVQLESLIEIIEGLTEMNSASHGDCIGADEEFHNVCRSVPRHIKIIGHPPTNSSKRAFCKFDFVFEEKDYITRNHDIVNSVDILLACPKETKEIIRSGTWATIRYARKVGIPVLIIYPDGKYIYEN